MSAVTLSRMEPDQLLRAALAEYNDDADGLGRPVTPKSPEPLLAKLQVNYARRRLTNYAALLQTDEPRESVRERVYGAIGRGWPHLASECRRRVVGRRQDDDATV